jgi:hypothetical protein
MFPFREVEERSVTSPREGLSLQESGLFSRLPDIFERRRSMTKSPTLYSHLNICFSHSAWVASVLKSPHF